MGNARALYLYGCCLSIGEGMKQDIKLSIKQCTRAADLGYKAAVNWLGTRIITSKSHTLNQNKS